MEKFQVQTKIQEVLIDYLITIDEAGEVIRVKPLIYDLPEIAQKLIFGKKPATLDREIKAYGGLIPYILPLVLNNRLPSYKSAYKEVVNYILSLPPFKPPILADSWDKIEIMIEKKEKCDIRDLGYCYRTIDTDFFLSLIPFLELNQQRVAFGYIGKRKHKTPKKLEELKNHLINELKAPYSTPYASGILKTLSRMTPPSEDIFKAVTTYYYQRDDKSEDTLTYIADALKKHPNETSKSIGFEILNLNKKYAATAAASLLIKTFNAEKEVIDIIMPQFLAADSKISEVALHIFSTINLNKYLPKPEKILEILVEILTKEKNSIYNSSSNNNNNNILYRIFIIGKLTGLVHLYDEFYTLLDHEKTYVKNGILYIILRLIDEDKRKKDRAPKLMAKYEKYSAPRFIDKYLALTKEEHPQIIRKASKIVILVSLYYKDAKHLNILLKFIKKREENTIINREAMEGINKILASIPYQPQIEPVYLKALEESSLRKAALLGLKFSPNQAFKTALSIKYGKDPSIDVRAAADLLLNSNENNN